jgi:hypothetical protein
MLQSSSTYGFNSLRTALYHRFYSYFLYNPFLKRSNQSLSDIFYTPNHLSPTIFIPNYDLWLGRSNDQTYLTGFARDCHGHTIVSHVLHCDPNDSLFFSVDVRSFLGLENFQYPFSFSFFSCLPQDSHLSISNRSYVLYRDRLSNLPVDLCHGNLDAIRLTSQDIHKPNISSTSVPLPFRMLYRPQFSLSQYSQISSCEPISCTYVFFNPLSFPFSIHVNTYSDDGKPLNILPNSKIMPIGFKEISVTSDHIEVFSRIPLPRPLILLSSSKNTNIFHS